jgi:hypothetical protein
MTAEPPAVTASTFGDKTSRGVEEGDDTAKWQDFFSWSFGSLSGVTVRAGRRAFYGV